jgi:hypothetical protein
MAYRDGKWKVDKVDNGFILSFHTERIEKVQRYDRRGNPTHIDDLTQWDEHEEAYLDPHTLAKRLVTLMKAKQ